MLFPQSERQSGFFLVLSCCGCWVCRAIAGEGGTMPKDYVEQLTCRSMKAISQGVHEPCEDRWSTERVCPHARWRSDVGRRKIANESDFRKEFGRFFLSKLPKPSMLQQICANRKRNGKLLARVRSDPRTLCRSCRKRGRQRRRGVVNETSATKHLPFGAESLSWRGDRPAIERRVLPRLTLIGLSGGAPLNGIP